MKVVFLDLDGTLRSDASVQYWRDREGDVFRPHPEAQALLEKFIEKSKAKLVITGRDRSLDLKELRALFNKDSESILIQNLFDTTPILRNGTRGEEIRRFLMHHSSRIKQYVVLDASDDLYPLDDLKVVQTNPETGLTETDISEAYSKLH